MYHVNVPFVAAVRNWFTWDVLTISMRAKCSPDLPHSKICSVHLLEAHLNKCFVFLVNVDN